MAKLFNNDVSVVLCGEAGQGIQTIEYILTRVLKLSGFNVFATKEYMSRIRGGSNSTEIRISSKKINAFIERIDILIPLDQKGLIHLSKRVTPKSIIIGEKEKLKTDMDIIDVPFEKIAMEIGGRIYANMIAIGFIAEIFKCEQKVLEDYVTRFFSKKGDEIIAKNLIAVKRGVERCSNLTDEGRISTSSIEKDKDVCGEILLNGADAVGLGALMGGCNFISAYPMSPSTGILIFLSQYSRDFGIIAEQAEDEISAINMAIGAWYGGARAMVTTSGGGFALMSEGVSLSGILETPVVVHIAQRPGPATGLPTRTEQGDLNLALYSGHGEFPRIILSPGTIEDAFYLTQTAFNLASEFQVPVIILTDQYLMDSYYNLPIPEISQLKIEKHIMGTKRDYKRYQLTDNGVSPRGIPGFGEGLVVVDSDEHDEAGHLTEDLEIRIKMVNKRLKKLELIKKAAIPPVLHGTDDYDYLVICWGSTFHTAKEAVSALNRDDVSVLYFKQVYPIHDDTLMYLKRAKQMIIIENNATSQFGELLRLNTGINIDDKVLKYNGLPFTVEEIYEKLKHIGD